MSKAVTSKHGTTMAAELLAADRELRMAADAYADRPKLNNVSNAENLLVNLRSAALRYARAVRDIDGDRL